jgi:hypothetical protein
VHTEGEDKSLLDQEYERHDVEMLTEFILSIGGRLCIPYHKKFQSLFFRQPSPVSPAST